MMDRLIAAAALLLAGASLSCQGREPIDEAKAGAIAYAKLSAAAPERGVDVSKLPPPTVEQQDEKLVYEFKDREQNAWIVIIVHPDGFAEVSFDRIESRGSLE